VTLEAARDQATALMFFMEMVYLHQRSWQARGETGAFATEFFRHFHQELIRKRFDCGEIQLLRITAGETTIGCLYNFVFKGKVYFYQSGVNYEDDSRLKPGFTSHVEAIKYNAAIGNACYDFLAGDAAYKDKLSTHQHRLVWATVQKPRIQFRIESELRLLKRVIRQT
jgi:CelD/BcsL family acetyltransferase involved in cellulose biosynthesis